MSLGKLGVTFDQLFQGALSGNRIAFSDGQLRQSDDGVGGIGINGEGLLEGNFSLGLLRIEEIGLGETELDLGSVFVDFAQELFDGLGNFVFVEFDIGVEKGGVVVNAVLDQDFLE